MRLGPKYNNMIFPTSANRSHGGLGRILGGVMARWWEIKALRKTTNLSCWLMKTWSELQATMDIKTGIYSLFLVNSVDINDAKKLAILTNL